MNTIPIRASAIKSGDYLIINNWNYGVVNEVYRDKRCRKIGISRFHGDIEFLPWDRRVEVNRDMRLASDEHISSYIARTVEVNLRNFHASLEVESPPLLPLIRDLREEQIVRRAPEQENLDLFGEHEPWEAACARTSSNDKEDKYNLEDGNSSKHSTEDGYTFRELLLGEGWPVGEIVMEFKV